MLNEEVKRYRELSGDDNPHTPISRIGGYLDGYERALSEQRTGHWILTKDGFECTECGCTLRSRADLCQYCGVKMLKVRDKK